MGISVIINAFIQVIFVYLIALGIKKYLIPMGGKGAEKKTTMVIIFIIIAFMVFSIGSLIFKLFF